MSNIVNLGGEPITSPEQSYDYKLVLKTGDALQAHGFLSFNPVYAAVVDDVKDGKILVMVPLENLQYFERLPVQ